MPKPKNFSFLIIAATAVVLIVTAAALIDHPIPKHRLRKRNPIVLVKPISPPPSFGPTFDWEQEEYLQAHNDIRKRVGVPPLTWSANLSAAAYSWAIRRNGDCNYRRHSQNPYGESIFFMNYKEFTPREVVQWWYNEHKLYDHLHHRCMCRPERAGCECGHYLNIVWATTRRVGCSGSTYCHNQKGVYVVCNYDPPGLIPWINPFTGTR